MVYGTMIKSTLLVVIFRATVAASTENLVKAKESPQFLTKAHRLIHDLFKLYNKDLRPVYNDSDAVLITMHLWFKQVLKVDEIDQILTIYCWTEQYWNDQFLSWDPELYDGISVLHVPVEKIWRPDVLVYNNADMNINENEVSTNVVLNHTGDLICFRAIITKVTCNLDMKYFPFDQQRCNMTFASWSYDGSKVMVIPKQSKNNLEYYIENTEWKLLDFHFATNIKYYDCCPEPYPEVIYHFVIERNPSYYILNLIIPSVFITVVTMVGFFTPYSSTGENTEKVSLGVTALLSLAIILLMVADKMPATSKVIPLIGKYYIGLIWLIFAATIITTVTLRLQSKGNAGKPLDPQTKKLFFKYIAKFLFMKVDLPPNNYPILSVNGKVAIGCCQICSQSSARCEMSRSKLAPNFNFQAAVTPSALFPQLSVTRIWLEWRHGQTSHITTPRKPASFWKIIHLTVLDTVPNSVKEATTTLTRPQTDAVLADETNRRLSEPMHSESTFNDTFCSKILTSPSENDNSSPVWKLQERKAASKSKIASILECAGPGNLHGSQFVTPYAHEHLDYCVRKIRLRMEWKARYTEIQREWGQMARVVERLLMILFVVGTVLFSVLIVVFAVPVRQSVSEIR